MSNQLIVNDLRFNYDDHAWCIYLGFQMGRLEFVFGSEGRFDDELNEKMAKLQSEIIEEVTSIIALRGIKLPNQFDDFYYMNNMLLRQIDLLSGRHRSFYLIGMCSIRITLVEPSKNDEEKIMMLGIAKSCINEIPRQYLADKDLFFQELVGRKCSTVIELADYLSTLESISESQSKPKSLEISSNKEEANLLEILKIMADKAGDRYYVYGQTGSIGKESQGTFLQLEQKQALAEAAAEIQRLLKQLDETNPTATVPEKVAYVDIATKPAIKQRAIAALKEGGETAIDEFVLENKYLKVVKAIVKGWLQPN